MNYQETIDYLYNQLPVYQKEGKSAYKEGLDNSLALDAYFDYPHRKYKTIHVAGTNGKGSTSHLLAAILQRSGYKVGLYTSPHLVDFRERIRINGSKIEEQYIVDFVAKYRSDFEPIHPSFFELTMMMSFLYFAENKVDVAIIEVGLGGRLDSTNIITPELSVITNIGLDHTQFLGDTVEKIAVEKAGIIKKGVPVVIGEASDSIRSVFQNVAERVGSPIVYAEDEKLITSSSYTPQEGWIFETKGYPHLQGELSGYAQIKNAATVLSATKELQQLGYNIPQNAVYEGFAQVSSLTGLIGRWQVIQKQNPKIICDTGHNVHGLEYVIKQLNDENYDHLYIVIGMVNDKDIRSVLNILPRDAYYYFTKANIPRALNESELQLMAEEYDLQGVSFSTVEKALTAVLSIASTNDLVFIGGSNFIVAEAIEYFQKRDKL